MPQEQIKKCCICKSDYIGWGHNPEPVKTRGRCCDRCNFSRVIPARLEHLKNHERKNLEHQRKQEK